MLFELWYSAMTSICQGHITLVNSFSPPDLPKALYEIHHETCKLQMGMLSHVTIQVHCVAEAPDQEKSKRSH